MAKLQWSKKRNIAPQSILGLIIQANAEDLVHIVGDTIMEAKMLSQDCFKTRIFRDNK